MVEWFQQTAVGYGGLLALEVWGFHIGFATSTGIWCHVDWQTGTAVSEDLSASIFRVARDEDRKDAQNIGTHQPLRTLCLIFF